MLHGCSLSLPGCNNSNETAYLASPLTTPATGRGEHGFRPPSPRLDRVAASQGSQDVAMSYYRETPPRHPTRNARTP